METKYKPFDVNCQEIGAERDALQARLDRIAEAFVVFLAMPSPVITVGFLEDIVRIATGQEVPE